ASGAALTWRGAVIAPTVRNLQTAGHGPIGPCRSLPALAVRTEGDPVVEAEQHVAARAATPEQQLVAGRHRRTPRPFRPAGHLEPGVGTDVIRGVAAHRQIADDAHLAGAQEGILHRADPPPVACRVV